MSKFHSFDDDESMNKVNCRLTCLRRDCDDCDRSFDSEVALQQHLRDLPAHAPSLDCETCDRSFDSEEALQQHLQDSRIHEHEPECRVGAAVEPSRCRSDGSGESTV
jgi:Zinc-finger double-stranded RNA-binding/Zinc-finger of C2H2 type